MADTGAEPIGVGSTGCDMPGVELVVQEMEVVGDAAMWQLASCNVLCADETVEIDRCREQVGVVVVVSPCDRFKDGTDEFFAFDHGLVTVDELPAVDVDLQSAVEC